MLTVAAVIGRRFQLALLERVAQLPEDELLERVEIEGEGPVGSFGFTHDLVRDTLQGALSGTRRARLHARVAQALLDHGADADPARALRWPTTCSRLSPWSRQKKWFPT